MHYAVLSYFRTITSATNKSNEAKAVIQEFLNKAKVKSKDVMALNQLDNTQATQKFLGQNFLNSKNSSGYTALHFAVRLGLEEIVKLFLNHNIDLNPTATVGRENKKYNGYTALHLAVAKGHENVVDVLLHAVPEIHLTTTASGKTALQLAVDGSKFEIAKTLVQYCPKMAAIPNSGAKGRTILQLLACHEHKVMANDVVTDEKHNFIESLLACCHHDDQQEGSGVNPPSCPLHGLREPLCMMKDKCNRTPLHFADRAGEVKKLFDFAEKANFSRSTVPSLFPYTMFFAFVWCMFFAFVWVIIRV